MDRITIQMEENYLTHKERTRRALQNERVDRLPTQINYTASMGELMSAMFGIRTAELPIYLDNHMLRIDLSYKHRRGEDGKSVFDWWGAGHATSEEGYFINISPLANNPDLDSFDWPDPNSPGLFEESKHVIDNYSEEYFIIPNLGWALFERAWSLRGFEQLLLDLALDPEYVGELLDRIVEIQLVLIQRFLDLGVDGGYFGDDYGAQKGMLFSPVMWRELIKPRLERLFSPFVEQNLPVILHSDGGIQEILPDLVEIGLTTLNPVQPEALKHKWLRENFQNKITFYGGVSTQTVLPHGNPRDVFLAVQNCIRDLAPMGTGLLIAPSHRMMSDIPMENIEALISAFRRFSS
jgi:uroporphyrinogen decarboxylase